MKSAEERIAEAMEYCEAALGSRSRVLMDDIRDILQPRPQRVTIAGVVFEETGEHRAPKAGEWHRVTSRMVSTSDYDAPEDCAFDILRPVEIVGAE